MSTDLRVTPIVEMGDKRQWRQRARLLIKLDTSFSEALASGRNAFSQEEIARATKSDGTYSLDGISRVDVNEREGYIPRLEQNYNKYG